MSIPAIVVLAMVLCGIFLPVATYLRFLFVFSSFSALSLLPQEMVGNANITPLYLGSLFMILKIWGKAGYRKSIFQDALSFKRTLFLWLFWITAVLGSIILPQLFRDDRILVYAVQSGLIEPVGPKSANFTQMVYLSLSCFLAFSVSSFVRTENGVAFFQKAILWGAYALVFSGLVDLLANVTGHAEILDSFRTAKYAILDEAQILDSRRVIGFTSEASSFGMLSAGLCSLLLLTAFSFSKPLHALFWGSACGLFALLSMSSTAYVMLAVLAAVFFFWGVEGVGKGGRLRRLSLTKKTILLALAVAIPFFIFLFYPEILEYGMNVVNILIFQKKNSESFRLRAETTEAALKAFESSFGFGVGIGSVKTSSLLVNILASTGIIGICFFLLFLAVVFSCRGSLDANGQKMILVRGIKMALIPILFGQAITGSTPNFGGIVGIAFGAVIGLSEDRLVKKGQYKCLSGVTTSESSSDRSGLLKRPQSPSDSRADGRGNP